MEVVRTNLEKCSLVEDLAQDRLEWRIRIHLATQHGWDLGQGFDDDGHDF